MENNKDLFKKYRARVVRNGILKSLLLALIIGFAVMFVTAFLSWALEFSAIIALAVGLGLTLVLTPVLYLVFFKPTSKAIVRLVDKLGLEERVVTMYELEHDESYLAMLQREDAKEKLKTVNSKMMSFRLSKAVVISASVLIVLGLGMTALSQWGPSFSDVGSTVIPTEKGIFDVIYEVRGSGFILGEVSQKVEEGSDASEVLAVEDEGYSFVGWTWLDERGIQRSSEVPLHQDKDVKSNLTVTAVFEPIDNVDDLLKGMDGEGNKETPPRDPTDTSGGGGGASDDESNPDTGIPGPVGPGSSGGIDKNQNNTVIDGQTDYSSEFDYEGQMDELNDDDSLPPEIKDAIGDYFDRIKP